jgi:hypothetical protein
MVDMASDYQMGWLRRKLESRRVRVGLVFGGWAVSIAVTLWTSSHEQMAASALLLAAFWPVYLFWPEIKKLHIIHPKGALLESPVWLYIVALGSLGLVALSVVNLTTRHYPTLLSADEWAQSYIHGKNFRIADLSDPLNMVVGRTFEDCHIYGPAVIMLYDRNDIGDSTFHTQKPDHIFIIASSGIWGGLGTGVIGLMDCKFRRCHFYNVSVTGDPATIEKWKTIITIK